jgi:hypothetical protein
MAEYRNAVKGFKKGQKEAIEYLKEPHKPRELMREEHFTKFILKYIKDMKCK